MKLFALVVLVSTSALAATPQHFGDEGALALSNDFQASVGYLGYNGSGAFSLNLQPSADYFLGHRFSVGAQLGLTLLSGSGETGVNFTFGPRVGVDIPVSPTVSFWPRFGVQVGHGDVVIGPLVSTGLSQTTFGLTFDLPVLWHVSDHFFLGVGPKVLAQIVGDFKETSAAVAFTLGGWL